MKDMIKTVTVLCVISLIAGALLGLVNEITFISDEEILNSKLKTAYAAEAFTPVQTASEEGLLGVYSPDGADGVYVYYVTDKGYGGEIKLLVTVENNLLTKIVKVEAGETAGLGDNAFKDKFLSQFYGTDISTAETYPAFPDKTSGVDAVSGATITSNAVLRMINLVIVSHKAILQGEAA